MIRGVAWRVDTFNGPSWTINYVAMTNFVIRTEVSIAALFNDDSLFLFTRTMGSICVRLRVAILGQQCTTWRVIHVGMSDKHMSDLFTLCRLKDCIDMRCIRRTRIDNGNLALPQNIGTRTVQSKRTGVIRDDTSNVPRYLR